MVLRAWPRAGSCGHAEIGAEFANLSDAARLTVRARMPADILGIRPGAAGELQVPGAAAQTRTVSGAIFGRAKRQLSRDLKYIAQTLLKLSFLSSSPTWPARESVSAVRFPGKMTFAGSNPSTPAR